MAVERTISDFNVGQRVLVISGEKKIPGTVEKLLKTKGMLRIRTEKGNVRDANPDDVQMRRGRPPGVKNVAKSESANSEKPMKVGKVALKAEKPEKAPKVAAVKNDDMASILDTMNQGIHLMQKAINLLRKRLAH